MIGRLGPVVGTKPDPLTSEQQELRKAAQGFEAIMIRKMLESARETPFTEDAPLTGGGMKQYKTMRDEHFAEIASQSGALGFARSIEEQLAQFVSPKIGE
ncbi:rod-binding protein [uncultured Erythrobacter sp.]|uniref:rod-binding protein n=1 Tax=uncultured Erythrobacter sp. TaxID=263913 RepID=UPI002631600E|nr:rod-binding protein [uncultured Erythrobacter sp.]